MSYIVQGAAKSRTQLSAHARMKGGATGIPSPPEAALSGSVFPEWNF